MIVCLWFVFMMLHGIFTFCKFCQIRILVPLVLCPMVIQTFLWRLCSPLHIPHGVIDPRVPLCGLCRFGVRRLGRMAILYAQGNGLNNLANIKFLKDLAYSDPHGLVCKCAYLLGKIGKRSAWNSATIVVIQTFFYCSLGGKKDRCVNYLELLY